MLTDTILVINCGSSSLKFSLICPQTGETLLNGLAERLSSESAELKYSFQNNKQVTSLPAPFDHQAAIDVLVNILKQHQLVEKVSAVGHRVVHGGEKYALPTRVDEQVKQTIAELAKLAPLHNPANLIGIEACEKAFKHLPQVAIFDTAFHQSMPEKAYIYGLPYSLYQEHCIRRYGFHGTSHYFVASQAAKLVNKPIESCNFISAHLGNGCSVSAVKNGKSVDTTLGLTPVEGVMMGTRSGDVDPGIIFHLINQLGYSAEQVNHLLNKESGLLGVSQLSNDCRELETAMFEQDHAGAKLALEIFCYRIAKAIAGFTASLTELDGIIFTGGIGENSSFVREQVLTQLSLLGVEIDPDKNEATRFGKSGVITTAQSRAAWVIPTNEEWVIAEQTQQILSAE
ncbi:acetate kinase [Thalassotalea sp. PLHSN55]|uniref:acetate kinase n=1 Tax=Thalassotalea sp. PLHSN55 TaxID=3435888 RepID=UPI003F863323